MNGTKLDARCVTVTLEGDRSKDVASRATAELHEVVVPAFTTVHLPPERAVITTPALVGLMERCVAAAEAASPDGRVGRGSVAVEVRHLAGLRAGEELTLRAERGDDERWSVVALASDGRTIAEGWILRSRER